MSRPLKFNSKLPALPFILRPALVVHIGDRLKIGHCFMMSCVPNVLPTQF